MRRRELIFLLGGAAFTSPVPSGAQQKAMPVIGVLSPASYDPFSTFVTAFRQGLSEAGYVEGQNLAIEYRFAEGHYDRLPALAADLVGRKVDLIMANSPPAALAAKSATSTIPIVFSAGTATAVAIRPACLWCETAFEPRKCGSPQRFCAAKCRDAFHFGNRRFAEHAVLSGQLKVADLRNGSPEACTLLPAQEHRSDSRGHGSDENALSNAQRASVRDLLLD